MRAILHAVENVHQTHCQPPLEIQPARNITAARRLQGMVLE
jgi:hypothetical protein